MLNQAFFVKVLAIQGDETVSGIRIETEIRKPFDTLLRSDINVAEAALQRANGPRKLDKSRKVNLQRGGNARILQPFTPCSERNY